MEIGVKKPVLERPNYTIYFERTPYGDLFIHCDYTGKWNKENKKKFLEDLEKLCNSIDEPIYAMPFIYDKRMQSFLKICNFIKLADVVCGDGVTRVVHIWRK